MKLRFFKCEHCGNIIAMVKDKGVPVMCCGQKMTEIIPAAVEAAHEKHIPVYTVNGNTVSVKVGSVTHPMQDVHYIEWIALETKNGYQLHELNPGEAPECEFALANGDEVVNVFAYCNLHGLWMA